MIKELKSIPVDEDGVYRWRYDLNLYKNHTIYHMIWLILFWIITVGFVFVMVFDAFQWSDFFFERLLDDLKFYGYFLLGMTAISLLGYLVYAATMGGQYCVEFEMDEKGILHKQVDSQVKRTKKISAATIAAGLSVSRLSMVGTGINAARTEMYSDFTKVRKVKSCPARHMIKVNCRFNHNQVYVDKEHFSFVYEYICSHCKSIEN